VTRIRLKSRPKPPPGTPVRSNPKHVVERLVRENLNFVHSMARGLGGCGVDHDDLVGAGNVGLVTAAQRYDEKRLVNGSAVRFITYAGWWVRAFMMKEIQNKHGGVTTQRLVKVFWGLRREMRLCEALGLDMTDERLADRLRVESSDVKLMRTRMTQGDIHMESPYQFEGNSGSATFGDHIFSDAPRPDEILEKSQIVERIRAVVAKCLSKMDPRRALIIRRRFFDDYTKTLAEVGGELGLSKERVRQLEEKALKEFKQALFISGVEVR
jgi:RNA polymerase sigma factor (sigma-70 family)